MHLRTTLTVSAILAIFASATLELEYCKSPAKEATEAPANVWQGNVYVSDAKCASCHQKEYSDWKISDHYKAMQPANDSTVLGNFNNAVLIADGVTSKFFRKDDKYFVNTQGDDGASHDYQVLFTFGYKPLQQYLVQFPGGKMQVIRASWDTEKKRWFHQYPGQKLAYHGDWLNWTGGGQNWNTMCAYCHSTNLQKNYNADSDTYHTTYSIINVSCETCHGPGKKHVDYIQSEAYKSGEKVEGSYIFTTAGKGNTAQVNMCAPCHMRAVKLTDEMLHTRHLMDDFIPEIPSKEFFYPDGQMNAEDYNYTSFLQSKMYSRGVRCSNCHNPHSGKLLFTDNQLCLQCHAKSYDLPTHTFHAVGTEGSLCRNCHMPGKFYMGNDYRHDHSFRVPRPDLSVQYGTPNACNNCHKDKPFKWAADAVVKWFGPKRKYHFADDLVPGSRIDAQSEAHLVRLLGDTAVPNIVKATAVSYLGNIETQASLQSILQSLNSDNGQVRYRALKALEHFPAQDWLSIAGNALSDSIRAVRIAAAELYVAVPDEQVPVQYHDALTRAKGEMMGMLSAHQDFPEGNLNLGDYYMRIGEPVLAEKYYTRALRQDSLLNIARINLASVKNALRKNGEALALLQLAIKVEPNNAHAYYSLALLQVELKDAQGAMKDFEKAVQLKSAEPKVYYNYGLLLQQAGKSKDAVSVLQKGLQIEPINPDLLYALTYVYMQSNDLGHARDIASQLQKVAPNNPDYVDMYRRLGLQ